jgi:hypothetical protein
LLKTASGVLGTEYLEIKPKPKSFSKKLPLKNNAAAAFRRCFFGSPKQVLLKNQPQVFVYQFKTLEMSPKHG